MTGGTRTALQLAQVTNRPVLIGSAPSCNESSGVPVAYCGRVPVRVRGAVLSGDVLVPSGRNVSATHAKAADVGWRQGAQDLEPVPAHKP